MMQRIEKLTRALLMRVKSVALAAPMKELKRKSMVDMELGGRRSKGRSNYRVPTSKGNYRLLESSLTLAMMRVGWKGRGPWVALEGSSSGEIGEQHKGVG